MTRKSFGWLVGGIVCGWLVVGGAAHAWPFHCNQGQAPSSYSPLHYWVPPIYRVRACVHPAEDYIYPAGFDVYPKHCPVPCAPSPYFEPIPRPPAAVAPLPDAPATPGER
jgi:hypothetical protein